MGQVSKGHCCVSSAIRVGFPAPPSRVPSPRRGCLLLGVLHASSATPYSWGASPETPARALRLVWGKVGKLESFLVIVIPPLCPSTPADPNVAQASIRHGSKAEIRISHGWGWVTLAFNSNNLLGQGASSRSQINLPGGEIHSTLIMLLQRRKHKTKRI